MVRASFTGVDPLWLYAADYESLSPVPLLATLSISGPYHAS